VTQVPAFDEWEALVGDDQQADPLWRMAAYRYGLFAVEVAWSDVRALGRTLATRGIGAQLYQALGSIPAHIAEGYSRSSGPDRVRFFEYALGSTRESIVWYRVARPVLGSTALDERVATLVRIRKLLLTAIPAERSRRVRRR
jgi:four helix bundle protein